MSCPQLETEDEKGFELSTEVDNRPPSDGTDPELIAYLNFGLSVSHLVFGRSATLAELWAWLDSQQLAPLESCDVPRSPCYSLDRNPCQVERSGECSGPLSLVRLTRA